MMVLTSDIRSILRRSDSVST